MSAQAVRMRKATHAGSWYSNSATELNDQLVNWLNLAGEPSHTPARAIIAPHAGYRYCGACAAYAYKQIDPTLVKHVFILGPSHHASMFNCGLSPARIYHTPLGDLNIDNKIYEELYETGEFRKVSLSTDEDEHSIEMHLPYIAKVMENQSFTIVPVMVGSISTDQQIKYGKIFSSYLADPSNLFVISSDFCHWGSRFRFQFYDNSWGEIHQSIEKLDHIGMKAIEELSPFSFSSYLQKYSNTICGRNAIGVLLNAVHSLRNLENNAKPSLKFLNYAQSSRCLDKRDSSVSYAAASLVIT